MKVYVIWKFSIAAHLVAALINDDRSGLNDHDERAIDALIDVYSDRFPGCYLDIHVLDNEQEFRECELLETMADCVKVSLTVSGDCQKNVFDFVMETIECFRRPSDWPDRSVSISGMCSYIHSKYQLRLQPKDLTNILETRFGLIADNNTVEL